MIKKLITFTLSAVILLTSASVFAEEKSNKDGIFTYTITDKKTVIITCVDDKSGKVVVPDKIADKLVTEIAGGAFGGSSQITEIYIPDSVKTIGSMCFAYSTSIKSIRLSSNITEIDDGLFYQCSSLTGITIPYGVTNINSKAFAMCQNLTSVTIPNSMKKIETDAFSNSKNVTIHCALNNSVGYDYAEKNNIKTEELITVYVNDEEIVFDQPPITDTKKFRTLVPIRAVLEKMGAKIEWYNDMNYAGIDIGENRLLIKPNADFMMVNGKAYQLSSSGIEYNNRILIPIRDVVESVGGKVAWDEFNKTIKITYNN